VIERLESRTLFSDTSVYITRPPTRASENGATISGFHIWRIGDTSAPLTVKFQIGGTATNGVDYGRIGSEITLPAGVATMQVKVRPFDDTKIEKVESVTMTLLADAAYDFGITPSSTIRITDNDFNLTSTTINWTTRAPNPIIRAEALRAVVDNKLYVFGGFSGDLGPVTRSDVYDPIGDTWTRIADLPKRITHVGVAVDGHDIYFAGGYVGIGATGYNQTFGTTDVWKYNTDSNTFTAMPAMPKAMAGGGAVVINRVLHYFGGDNLSRNDDGSHFALNLDDRSGWKTLASMPNPRSHMGYVAVGGKIYTIAGQHGNDAGLTTQKQTDVYDPATDGWTRLADTPLAVSHIASATVALGNYIVILGGETANGVATKQVNAYNISTNTWTTLSSLPATRFSGVAGVIDNAIYFTTGSSQTTTWKGIFA
jgi:N-acetylneuraminic acid mutarotase